MSSLPDGEEPPKILVAGRTRIGKGEFISTANHLLGGSALPDIVSDGMVSYTKEIKGHSMRLANRNVEMVDTVGFDDSSGTNISEETLLRFLAKSGKADLYPPLVMIQTLSALETDLLTKMSAVFPEIVVGFRSEKKSRLDQARRDIESVCKRKPVKVFHLQGFLSEDIDDGKSRQLYDTCVSDIVRFFETLTPSRKELDFSSDLLKGKWEKIPCDKETRTEIIEDSHVKTECETKTVQVAKTEVDSEDAKLHGAVGGTVAGLGGIAAVGLPPVGLTVAACGALYGTLGVIFGRKDKITHVDEQRDFKVNFIGKEKIRRTFVREVQEVWKILTGEIKVFKGYEYGPWEIMNDEVLHRAYHKA